MFSSANVGIIASKSSGGTPLPPGIPNGSLQLDPSEGLWDVLSLNGNYTFDPSTGIRTVENQNFGPRFYLRSAGSWVNDQAIDPSSMYMVVRYTHRPGQPAGSVGNVRVSKSIDSGSSVNFYPPSTINVLGTQEFTFGGSAAALPGTDRLYFGVGSGQPFRITEIALLSMWYQP